MAVTIRTHAVASAPTAARRSATLVAAPAGRRGNAVVVQAVVDGPQGRREFLGAGLAISTAVLTVASPAQAFLGIGEDGNLQETYATRTAGILETVRTTLELPKDDPSKEDKVKELRKDINGWVATYRREPKVSGKPSYSNTYSVLNALAGHYNSFGPTAPIPRKRLERINKELADATLFLSRGR